MVIKSLMDNTTSNPTLRSEHGLSLYIETKDHKVLFDVGQSDAFLSNAERMGVDIAGVEMLILSHGHYDHGGGLKTFLEVNDHGKVYLTDLAYGHYYSKKADGTMKYIGLDRTLKNNPRLVFLKGNERICDCLEILRNESKRYPLPTMNHYLYKKVNGDYVKDDFVHEQNLMIHCDGKTVLITACAHNGILNILDSYRQHTGTDPNAVVGGFHLSSTSRNESASASVIKDIAKELASRSSEFYTCHCTGVGVYKTLKKDMGEQICYLSAGKSIHI